MIQYCSFANVESHQVVHGKHFPQGLSFHGKATWLSCPAEGPRFVGVMGVHGPSLNASTALNVVCKESIFAR